MTQPDPKYHVTAKNVGVVGDHNIIYGGINFYNLTSPTGKPLQRPPRVPHFTGRKKELAQLLEDLKHPQATVSLCGPGGVGKTALATEAIWQLAGGNEPPDLFPDGLVFYSFYGRPDPALAFEHLVRSFEPDVQRATQQEAQRILAGKRALLFLDGTEVASDLASVLAITGGCTVIVTSRKRGDAPNPHTRQQLNPLPAPEAVDLLQKWANQSLDPAVAEQICQQVDGLPLAVRLVGRYLDRTGETTAEYLQWLETTPIAALSHGDHREESVELLLQRSLAQFSELVCQVLAGVGQLALQPFDVAPLVAALDRSEQGIRHQLGTLVNYGLLLRDKWGLYQVSHALVHTYASRRLEVSEETLTRLADYYTTLTKEQSKLGPTGYAVLDNARPHLLKMLNHCVDRQVWEPAQQLVWAVGGPDGYLSMQGHWMEWNQAVQQGLQAARAQEHRHNEVAFLDLLGSTLRCLGQMQQGIESHEQALAIARQEQDKESQAVILGNLGVAYENLGQPKRAIKLYKQAISIAQEIRDKQGEGRYLGNLGTTYRNLGQPNQAIKFYKQALTIFQEIDHTQYKAQILGNLGIAYADLDQSEQAIEYLEQALLLTQEIGDKHSEVLWSWNLGELVADNDPTRAVELMSVRVAFERGIGHPDTEKHAQRVAQIQTRLGQEKTDAPKDINAKNIGIVGDHARVEGGIHFGQKIINFFTSTSDQQRDLRNRQIMLQRVHDFWVKGVLEQSLHNEVLIELGMETKPEAVEYPWDMIIRCPNQPNRTLPPGTKMIDVFDESGSCLLILGEPGSGKTTMLLGLTRDLIKQAAQDPALPIPAVFSLSSWVSKEQSIAEWLIEELRTKYNIPKKIAEPWVENDKLLLMLDSLDEVNNKRQNDCVQAINEFREQHLISLVVCSRIADYEALATKLKLQEAVLLQQLGLQQVDSFLADMGQDVSPLRKILQHDPVLQELTRSPLMLSVMILTYNQISFDELSNLDSVPVRNKYLFANYVQRMFERRSVGRLYSKEQIGRWLERLAKNMSEHTQTVYLIERMQPSWLSTRKQYWAYIFGTVLIAGLPFGLLGGLFAGPTIGLVLWLVMGLIGGLSNGWINIDPVEKIRWSWKSGGKGFLITALGLGLPAGLIMKFLYESFGSPDDLKLVSGLVLGIFSALFLGSLFGLYIGILAGLQGIRLETGMIPNHSIWLSARNAVTIGLIVGLIFGLLFGSIFSLVYALRGLGSGVFIGLTIGLLVGLINGGAAFLKHCTLRFILWRTGQLPFRLVPFLDYCVDRIFLRRVGGGYIFIHRYLMEYFASLTEEDIERLTQDHPTGRQPT